MNGKYRITEDEYVQANKLFSAPSKRVRWVYGVVVLSLILFAIFADNIFIRTAAIGALMGGISIHSLFRYIYAPWRTRKQYRVNTSAQEQVKINQTEHGLHFKTRSGEAVLEWQQIIQWRESKKLLLIYQAANEYHIIPKRVGNITQDIIQVLNREVGNPV
ncbi:MAG: YcxB family protein [Desulfobulbaceae bacterium]|nr:YcxB family protein [Desulfobulbaceae bacterium]